MKFGVGVDYSLKALLLLAERYPTTSPVRVEEIAESQDIPENYLRRLLIELKRGGLVASQKGPNGGYMLARPPAEVTMADVLRAFHSEVFDSPALTDPHCPPELREAWRKLQKVLDETAAGIDFQQLLDEAAEKGKMYYI